MRFRLRRAVAVLFGLALCTFIALQFIHVDERWQFVLPAQQFFARSFEEKRAENDPSSGDRPDTDVWNTQSSSDRILEQIRYVPRHDDQDDQKVIFVLGGLGDFGAKLGHKEFERQNCSVKNCFLTESPNAQKSADAVLMKQMVAYPDVRKDSKPGQIWIFYALESPYSLPDYDDAKGVFNWTATYRRDSTIVTPYARWVPFDPPVKSPSLDKNFAQGKTKQVAWFVSNCGANNNRLEYAKELGKYINVDIIGQCGEDSCPRNNQDCWESLNEDYKFYLSFENSNCRDYITEKFFLNGLGYDVIPIVMGGHPDDYRKVAPPHSFISVDDYESPKRLADYLNRLDSNDKLYSRYFHWKGTGKFINTKFWCRLCAMLNDKDKPTRIVDDLEGWWDGEGICQREPWSLNKGRGLKQ